MLLSPHFAHMDIMHWRVGHVTALAGITSFAQGSRLWRYAAGAFFVGFGGPSRFLDPPKAPNCVKLPTCMDEAE